MCSVEDMVTYGQASCNLVGGFFFAETIVYRELKNEQKEHCDYLDNVSFALGLAAEKSGRRSSLFSDQRPVAGCKQLGHVGWRTVTAGDLRSCESEQWQCALHNKFGNNGRMCQAHFTQLAELCTGRMLSGHDRRCIASLW